MLTKTFNEILKFDNELTLIQLIKNLQEKYGEEFRELVWEKKKRRRITQNALYYY